MPSGPATPTLAGMLNRGYDPVRSVVIPEGNDDLIQDDLIEDFGTAVTQSIREPLRLAAISVHQVRQAGGRCGHATEAVYIIIK